MSVHIKYELTETQANTVNNLAVQFKRDIDNCNSGSIETRRRYHPALEDRFTKFLAVEFRLQNVKNVSAKHIFAYVEFLQETGKSPSYIMTELSAIRFWHKHSNCKNKLPDNKKLNLEKREVGKYNKGFLDSEMTKMVDVAMNGNRRDIVFGAYIVYHFGLRKNELATLRIYQLEEAIESKQLHIPNGKGGQARDIPLDTEAQVTVLQKILNIAKADGKKSSNYLFCDNHKNSVKKVKASLTNWMSNHIDEILDPDRKAQIKKGKKERADSGYGWHSIRHTYAQKAEERLIARGMNEEQARREISERLGHHRSGITKIYEE